MLLREVADTVGLSRRHVRTLVGDGTLLRLRRDVVVGSCVAERAASDPLRAHEIRLRTLLLTHPDVVASYDSAARVGGFPLLRPAAYVSGTWERGAWRGGADIRIRVAPLPVHHCAIVLGMRSTTPARTFADIARSGSFRSAVVLGDAVVRSGCGVTTLGTVVDECAEWADVGKARLALRFLDGRSESPLESASRAIIHERRLPPPELQTEFDLGPAASYRVDFFWRAQRVVGEADGLGKYDSVDVLRAEKVRQERLERLGLTVVRWTWRDMLVDTDATIQRLRRALQC
jgi:very-short-patch-repair endonuclease